MPGGQEESTYQSPHNPKATSVPKSWKSSITPASIVDKFVAHNRAPGCTFRLNGSFFVSGSTFGDSGTTSDKR
jgi:hypothetical protein